MKHIRLSSASGADVIIFIDKITHIYSSGYGRCMIKLMNEEGVLVNETVDRVLRLIQLAHENN